MDSTQRLVVISNFIDSDDLCKITDLLSKAKTKKISHEHPTSKYDAQNERYVNLPSNTIELSDNNSLCIALDSAVARIKEEIERSFFVEVHEEIGYSVTTYVEGDALIGHFDGAEQVQTPSGYPHRDISSVLYLNDGYTGGILSFDIQEISIRPKAGTLVLFPGTESFTHSVSVIEAGLRSVIPQFWAVKNSNKYTH